MKKLIALVMVLAMALTLFAGCAGGNNAGVDESEPESSSSEAEQEQEQESQNTAVVPESALEILENVWNAFGEEEQFPVYGGDMETHTAKMEQDETYQIPNGPGAYDMTYGENLPNILRISEDVVPSVDDAATMIHMMLANNFTCGALHLTAGTDVESAAASIREALASTRWMCGFPDRYLVAVVGGEYIVVAFGLNDALTPFQTHLVECYPDVQIAYDENVA